MKRVKKFGVIWVLNKSEERSEKRVVFCSYRCFWESEKLMCEKIFSERAKFFCSRAAFKSSFFLQFFLFMRFDCYCIRFGLVLIGIEGFKQLIWVLCKFGGFWSVLLVFRRNLMYFGLLFCFTALSAICIEARYSRNIRDTNWLQFCWYKTFFSEEKWQKNWEFLNHVFLDFLNHFFSFFAFFVFQS